MRRVAWLCLRLAPFFLTCLAAVWLLTLSPFTDPILERSSDQLRLRLDAMMQREVTPAWLAAEAEAALQAEDLDRLSLTLDLSHEFGHDLPPNLLDRIEAFEAERSGPIERGLSCVRCAIDLRSCESLTQMGLCGVTVEMTPAGDLNAVRRAGFTYLEGESVDRLDLGLAVVGLGATTATMGTGGSSYTVKIATTFVRAARRVGTLTPALVRRLAALVQGAVKWDRMGDLVRLRIGPEAMVDTAKLDELSVIGGSLSGVARNTSAADAIALMKFVDGPRDAARLARVSDAAGPATRSRLEVLGKRRVFSAAVRLGDLAISAAAALGLLAAQVAGFIGQQLGNRLWRYLRRLLRPRQRPLP
ncbi:hypothetical protein [Salibaculum sp.]|uniref:hypothetical protein n=1 Tax=Salibaculum sp. TaxID=2855480 RepID=UPI002B4A3756|nr:hypothetical protein [Salibaculum sp.]HKL68186.1 hypothetical protein [Salibaculum sp.]